MISARLSVLFLVVLCTLPIKAAYYRSNSLAQKLEKIEYPLIKGWYLSSEGNRESLYEDGRLVSSRILGSERELFISEKGRRSIEYRNGRRERERLEDGQEIRYEYTEGGILKRALFSRDGYIEEIRSYSYSPSSGLVSVYSTLLDRSYFGRDAYTFREDGESIHVDIYPGNLLVREVLKEDEELSERPAIQTEITDSGNIVVKEQVGDDTLETTYSHSGDILSEIVCRDAEVSSRTEYSYYPDGALKSSVFTEEGRIITREYDGEGFIVTEECRSDGILTMTRNYQKDGRIVERSYRNGVPYSEVLLDKDGLRVLDLVML
ncbi:MAG: hypothetical protein IJ831_00660 [Spirochaetales bacterium]|nr:hypothetical protein [Spirochaetales bacterium]